MLEDCAEGYEWIANKPHYYQVKWAGKVYPTLPKGPHGKRSERTQIEVGHVRKLARFLGIVDCAKKILQQL